MRFRRELAVAVWLTLANSVHATRLIESSSLSQCLDNSAVTASSFHAIFFPGNGTISFSIDGDSQVSSNVTLEVNVIGYGYSVFSWFLDPCLYPGLKGICPMQAASLPDLHSNYQIPKTEVKKIPGKLNNVNNRRHITNSLLDIVYYIPDIDATVRLWVNETGTQKPLACLETRLTNGRTIQQGAVAWGLGFLSLCGLLSSAILFERGAVYAPSKVAAKVMLLLQYYQSLGLLGTRTSSQITYSRVLYRFRNTAADLENSLFLCSSENHQLTVYSGMIPLKTPPLVEAWTQNFQWSMGIARVSFVQTLCTWYQRSTGGTPSTLLSAISKISVRIFKRSNARAYSALQKAQSVRGIERVGFKAGIESTNFFVSAFIWFISTVLLLSSIMIFSKAFYYRYKKAYRHIPLHWCGPLWQDYFKGSLLRLVRSTSLLRQLLLTLAFA
jgi:hypothetical protein